MWKKQYDYLKSQYKNIGYFDQNINHVLVKVGYLGEKNDTNAHISIDKMRDIFIHECVELEGKIRDASYNLMFYETIKSKIPKEKMKSIIEIMHFSKEEQNASESKSVKVDFIIEEQLKYFFEKFIDEWVNDSLYKLINYLFSVKLMNNRSFMDVAIEWYKNQTSIQITLTKGEFERYRRFRNQIVHPQKNNIWSWNFRDEVIVWPGNQNIIPPDDGSFLFDDYVEMFFKISEFFRMINHGGFFNSL